MIDSKIEWISVDERLPEDGVLVLAAVYGTDIIKQKKGETLEDAIRRSMSGPGTVTVSFLSKEDGGWCDGYFGGPEIITPSYWAYFPEPPENPKKWENRP